MMEWWLYVVAAAVVVFALRFVIADSLLTLASKATKGVKKRIIERDQDDEEPTDDPPTP